MEHSRSELSLLEAAHIVARGGDLESELSALAEHVVSGTGARGAAIYVLDPVGQSLVPAAAAGIDPEAVAKGQPVAVRDERELVARVAYERRPLTAVGGEASSLLGGLVPDSGGLIALPLVTSDEIGTEDTEGVLLAAFAGEAPDPDATEDPLFALADLCAVAVRQARLVHALTERAEWIERVASTDALTGLPNRATFERVLELEIARATRLNAPLSIILFDIDGMVGINEREGQPAGDDVLRGFSSLLADQVRLVDTVGRLGSDEFGLIAPGGGGGMVAGRVREAAGRLRTPGGAPLSVRAAVATFPADGGGSTALMDAAAAALEKARA